MQVPQSTRNHSLRGESLREKILSAVQKNSVKVIIAFFAIISVLIISSILIVNSRFENGISLYEAASSSVLSLLLGVLTWRSLSIGRNQSEIMERHQELMELNHRPYIRPLEIDVTEKSEKEVLQIKLRNEGKGLASALHISVEVSFSSGESGKSFRSPDTNALLDSFPPAKNHRFTEAMRGGFLNQGDTSTFAAEPRVLWTENDDRDTINVQDLLQEAKTNSNYRNLHRATLQIAVAYKDRFDQVHLQYLYGTSSDLVACKKVSDMLDGNNTNVISSEYNLANSLEKQWFKMDMFNPNH